jgi:fatty-acyl-CoA synthase
VPCAVVELRDGASATPEEIIEFCRGHMARYKVPKQIVFGVLPKTSTGKIQKFQLRQQFRSAAAIE